MRNLQQRGEEPAMPAPNSSKPVPVERLLGGRVSIQILHRGQVYQLSLTRNDKLILTK